MDNYIYDYDFFDQYEEDYLIPKTNNNPDNIDQSNYDPFLDYNPNHIPSYYDENDEYDYLLEEPEAETPIKTNSQGKEKNVFNFHRINWEEIFKRPMSRYDLTKLIQAKHNPHVKSYNQLPYLPSLTQIQQSYQHILPFHEAVLQLFHSKPFKNIPLSPLLTKLTDNDHPQSYFLQYIPYLLEELRANVEQTMSSGYFSSGKMSFDLFPISLTSLQSTTTSSSINPMNNKGNHSSYSDTTSFSTEILLCKFYFWTYEDLLPSSDHSFMNEIIHLSIPTPSSTSNQKKPEPSNTIDIFGIAVRRSYDQHICYDIQKRIDKQNQNKSQTSTSLSLLISKDSPETTLSLPSQELNNKKSNKRKCSNQEHEINLLKVNKEQEKDKDNEKEKEKERIILEITFSSSQGKLLEEYLLLHSEKVVITWLCGLTPIERMYHSCLQPLPTSFHLQDQLLYAEIPSWDMNTSSISERINQELVELPDRPLNPIQKQVIRSLLPSSTKNQEDSGVLLTGIKVLIGPPGTGKTTTAITWLLNYIQLFPTQRFLVTSSSNQAIHILVSQITPYLTSTSTIAWLGIQKNIPTSLMNVHIHEYLHYLLQDIQQTQKKMLRTISPPNFIANNINNNHNNPHKQPQNRVLVSILTSFQESFQQLSQKLSQLLYDKGLLSKKRFQQRLKQQQQTNSSDMFTSEYIGHKLHERKTMIRFLKTLIKQINRLINQCNQLILSMLSTLNNNQKNSNNKQIPKEKLEDNAEESSFDDQIKQFNQYIQLIITHIQNKEGLIESYLLQRAQIVFSTLITSGRPWLTKQIDTFDLIIIDEASQALIPEIFIPLRFNPYVLILIGDPQQLPATILSTHNKQKYFENSLMHWLIKEHEISYQILTHQYRMHPNICHFISQQYYHNQLITPESIQQRPCILQANARLCELSQQMLLPQLLATSLFVDVSQGQEYKGHKLPSYQMNKSFLQSTKQSSKQSSKQSTYLHTDQSSSSSHVSLYNEEEAHAILQILSFLIQHCHFSISQIGILSFYTAQIQYIQHLYDQHIAPILYQQTSSKSMLSYQDWQRYHRLEIKTVDGYQGGEKDIILISMVRTNKSIGFLSDSRRLNVALSRSKYARWIIGNYTQLSDCFCEDIQVLCHEHHVKSDQYLDFLEFETQFAKLLH